MNWLSVAVVFSTTMDGTGAGGGDGLTVVVWRDWFSDRRRRSTASGAWTPSATTAACRAAVVAKGDRGSCGAGAESVSLLRLDDGERPPFGSSGRADAAAAAASTAPAVSTVTLVGVGS